MILSYSLICRALNANLKTYGFELEQIEMRPPGPVFKKKHQNRRIHSELLLWCNSHKNTVKLFTSFLWSQLKVFTVDRCNQWSTVFYSIPICHPKLSFYFNIVLNRHRNKSTKCKKWNLLESAKYPTTLFSSRVFESWRIQIFFYEGNSRDNSWVRYLMNIHEADNAPCTALLALLPLNALLQ